MCITKNWKPGSALRSSGTQLHESSALQQVISDAPAARTEMSPFGMDDHMEVKQQFCKSFAYDPPRILLRWNAKFSWEAETAVLTEVKP